MYTCTEDTLIGKVGCVIENDKGNNMKSRKRHNNHRFIFIHLLLSFIFFLVNIIIQMDYTKETTAYNGMRIFSERWHFCSVGMTRIILQVMHM